MIAGNTKDFTKGNVTEQLLTFAAPFIGGNLCMQLYNYADAAIVGKFLGAEYLAAVGASSPIIFVLIALGAGMSIGGSILVSGYFTGRKHLEIARTVYTLYLLLLAIGTVATIGGITLSEEILLTTGLPDPLMPLASEYLRIYLLSVVFTFGFNGFMALFRGVGNSLTPLWFLVVSAVLNVLLDLLFVPGLGFGIQGAAWATVISQATVFVAAILISNRSHPLLRFHPANIGLFSKSILLKVIRLGIPAGIHQTLVALGTVALITIINQFGTDVIAAYTAAQKMLLFIMVIPLNLSLALTNFVAQNAAVRQYDRIRKALRDAVKISFIVSVGILIVLSMFGTPLMEVFTDNLNIINIGKQYLLIIGLGFGLFCVMIVLQGVIRGYGDTIGPMLIALFSLWIIKVPAAQWLSVPLHEVGVWLCEPISWGTGILLTALYYPFVLRRHKK